MNVTELKDTTKTNKTVIAVGTFDGVHKAHAELIRKTAVTASLIGAVPAVWTFDDDFRKKGQSRIITPGERDALFSSLGVERVFKADFSRVKDLSPEEFCRDVLIGGCGAEYVLCGYNFRFGKGAEGDAGTLVSLMHGYGKGAVVLDPVKCGQRPVSSTAIRAALKDGDVRLAQMMLGRPFSVTLPVIHGRRLGTGMGYPTINQKYPDDLTPLRPGVYACRAYVGGGVHPAVSNVGVKPTVGAEFVTVETHIFGYDADMYGLDVCVEFIDFIRDEKKFGSLGELKAQIAKDASAALGML